MGTNNPFSPLWSVPKPAPKPQGICAQTSCSRPAFYRAPRAKRKGHLWFCDLHITSYNEQYSFLKGMSVQQIEQLQWKSKLRASLELEDDESSPFLRCLLSPIHKEQNAQNSQRSPKPKLWTLPKQHSALKQLGLKKDAQPAALHRQYRMLVKELHPDTAQKGDQERLLQVITLYRYLCGFLSSEKT